MADYSIKAPSIAGVVFVDHAGSFEIRSTSRRPELMRTFAAVDGFLGGEVRRACRAKPEVGNNMSGNAPPLGWYPDPAHPLDWERQWNGQQWTDQVRPRPAPPASDHRPAELPAQRGIGGNPEPDAGNTVTGLRPDIQQAWESVNYKIGKKRDVRKLIEYLHADEIVHQMAGGRNGGNQGLLVATGRRALFVSEGVINHAFEDFPYDRISSITSSRGVAFAKITVLAAGAARTIDQIERTSAQRIADYIREAVVAAGRPRQQVPVQISAPAQAGDDVIDQLQKLGNLRDQGIVTEAEFDAKKADLLSRL